MHVLGQLPRMLDRDPFIAFGVKQEEGRRQGLDGGLELVLSQEVLERRPVGVEVEAAGTPGPGAAPPRWPGRWRPRRRAPALGAARMAR